MTDQLPSREQQLTLRGQTLSLLPERAIFWHEQQLLIVADIHLGKEHSFQAAGIPVPNGTLDLDLQRLADIAEKTNAQELLLLGDLVHHASGLSSEVRARIQHQLQQLAINIRLIEGNHDQRSLPFLRSLPAEFCGPNLTIEPFKFQHEPLAETESSPFFIWSGHLHPVVNIRQYGYSQRLPAFVVERQQGILPAFGQFTGGFPVTSTPGRQLFPILTHQGESIVLPNRQSRR